MFLFSILIAIATFGNEKNRKTFGAYDTIIQIEAESVHKIKNIIADKMRNKPGIITMILFPLWQLKISGLNNMRKDL